MDYLKINIFSEPKPIQNKLWIDAQNKIWKEVVLKYRGYSNGDKDKSRHFNDKIWREIMDKLNAIIEEYPYPLVEATAYLVQKEFEARDLGAYSLEHRSE